MRRRTLDLIQNGLCYKGRVWIEASRRNETYLSINMSPRLFLKLPSQRPMMVDSLQQVLGRFKRGIWFLKAKVG